MTVRVYCCVTVVLQSIQVVGYKEFEAITCTYYMYTIACTCMYNECVNVLFRNGREVASIAGR